MSKVFYVAGTVSRNALPGRRHGQPMDTDGPWVSSRISEAYFLIQAIQTMFALLYNRKIYFPLKLGNSIRYEKKSC